MLNTTATFYIKTILDPEKVAYDCSFMLGVPQLIFISKELFNLYVLC